MSECVVVKSFLNELWNEKPSRPSDVHSIFSPKVIINSPLGKQIGRSSLQGINLKWMNAFPDMNISNLSLENINDNVVIATWTSRCTHEGMFQGFNASGKAIEYEGTTLFVFKDKQVSNYFCQINMVDLYGQLGFYLKKEDYTSQKIFQKDKTLLMGEIASMNPQGKELTKREVEMLCFFLYGYAAKEIGQVFNISYRTVEHHLEKAMLKLRCQNKRDVREYVDSKGYMPMCYDLYRMLKP